MSLQGIVDRALKPMRLTRLMVFARRDPPARTPADAGMPFEPVEFDASDGVRIRGWFIPAARAAGAAASSPAAPAPGPVVVFVHGWLWNRLGNVAGQVPFVDRDVDFMPAARALHDAGYHVLLIDLANHGESGSRLPVTFGVWEARDFIGAVRYLRARPDVDGSRIGALGCSMGGNTVIYGTPECQPVKAILAIQPAILPNFNRRFSRQELGPLGPASAWPMDLLYVLARAPLPSRHNPAIPARNLGATVVQYVQGTGDPWGDRTDVEQMVAATPNALALNDFPSTGRYEGYRFVSEAVEQVTDFFRKHL